MQHALKCPLNFQRFNYFDVNVNLLGCVMNGCNKDAVSRVTCIYRIKQVSLSLPLLSLYCWFTMLLTIVLFSPSLSNSKR